MEVIKVENLYKQYRLGQVSTGSIAHDLNRWWHTVRGKEDPYEKITGVNNREDSGSNDYVWALQDINFSVKQGEVLGIIGRNGAGKSTLLKILSKVTSPTKGNIKVKGRIASLLEVGTGFHPELTGRENIFLNGAILGMTKSEIRSKFDEIVAFSGVEKYIDTPVKRYSSGMYVRLAFAVAAHLEPEILIVDEVLAVGDAEFQKKCLGKMKDVSGEGRTVLFVSHNMEAVKGLCQRAVFLEHGKVVKNHITQNVIDFYLQNNRDIKLSQKFEYSNAPGNEFAKLKSVSLKPKRDDGKPIITVKSELELELEYWNELNQVATNLSLHLNSFTGECVFAAITQIPVPILQKGVQRAKCFIPKDLLNTGFYSISIYVVKDSSIPICLFDDLLMFEVEEERDSTNWYGRFPGFIRPKLNFKIINND